MLKLAPPLGTEEFVRLWRNSEEIMGYDTEAVERGSLVKTGNSWRSFGGQERAQYGRLMFGATATVAKLLELKESDVFVDIGSGIGNVVMQAACTAGCESRGVELLSGRHVAATQFWTTLCDEIARRDTVPTIGECVLKQGDIVREKRFIVQANKAFVNNHNEVFSARGGIARDSDYFIDDHVAAIFALMKPGSKMLTLDPLVALGDSLTQANKEREINGMPKSHLASFFECENVVLEPYEGCPWRQDDEPVASWSHQHPITACLYTRTKQGDAQEAMFLCTNRKCYGAKEPTVAVIPDTLTLHRECVFCLGSRRTSKRHAANKRSKAN